MGKLERKNKERKSGGRFGGLFGRGQKGSAKIDQSDGQEEQQQQETYRPIGRVNPRHLTGSQSWDVKYLGCIPAVHDWQSPQTRSEFMTLVDEAQRGGQLLWCSLTPKLLHLSPSWLLITDHRRKVTYCELLVATLGSLAYAEDDGRHILGLKAAKKFSGEGNAIAEEEEEEEGGGYCCYVLECDSEVTVRQISSVVGGHFQTLLSQQEAKLQEQLSLQRQQQQTQQVKAKMLKRLSVEKTGKERPPRSGKTSPDKLPSRGETPAPVDSSTVDVGLGASPQPLSLELSKWSSKAKPSRKDAILEEIGREFSAITKEPSKRRVAPKKAGPNLTRLSMDHKSKGPPGPAMYSTQLSTDEMVPPIQSSRIVTHDANVVKQELEDTSNVKVPDSPDLFATRSRTRISLRDFEENFSNANSASPSQHVLESSSKVKTLTEEDESRATDGTPARNMVTPPPPPPPPLTSQAPTTTKVDAAKDTKPDSSKPKPQTSPQREKGDMKPTEATSSQEPGPDLSKAKLRTSLILEHKEEGDKETKIDGDSDGTVLIQTIMSEKETAIVGKGGHALLLPASQLGSFEQEEAELSRARMKPAGPHGGAGKPPAAAAATAERGGGAGSVVPKPAAQRPAPAPTKPERQPWPVLVGVSDAPRDSAHQRYLARVSEALGLIEYRQFRQDWLSYQKCSIDVFAFCKKTKLIFRGSRVPLRHGARVLVDPGDQKTFDDVLSGKITEAPKSSVLKPAPPPVMVLETPPTSHTPATPTSKLTSFAPPSSPAPKPAPPSSLAGLGSIGAKLKMFESGKGRGEEGEENERAAAMDATSGGVHKLIQATDKSSGPGGASLISEGTKPSKVFPPTADKPPPSPQPKRGGGGILAKIAAFEGGTPSTLAAEDDDRETPRPRKQGGGEREEPRRREAEDHRERKERRTSHKDDSADRKRGRDRHREAKEEKGRRHSRKEDSADRKHRDKGESRKDRRKSKDEKRHRNEYSDEEEEAERSGHRSRRERQDDSFSDNDSDERRHHRHHDRGRRSRKSSRQQQHSSSMGLQGILDAGKQLLSPEQPLGLYADDTIDALAKLLSKPDDSDQMMSFQSQLPPPPPPQPMIPPPQFVEQQYVQQPPLVIAQQSPQQAAIIAPPQTVFLQQQPHQTVVQQPAVVIPQQPVAQPVIVQEIPQQQQQPVYVQQTVAQPVQEAAVYIQQPLPQQPQGDSAPSYSAPSQQRTLTLQEVPEQPGTYILQQAPPTAPHTLTPSPPAPPPTSSALEPVGQPNFESTQITRIDEATSEEDEESSEEEEDAREPSPAAPGMLLSSYQSAPPPAHGVPLPSNTPYPPFMMPSNVPAAPPAPGLPSNAPPPPPVPGLPSNALPPPPPPVQPLPSNHQAPPPLPRSTDEVHDERDSLLEQIKRGKALRKVPNSLVPETAEATEQKESEEEDESHRNESRKRRKAHPAGDSHHHGHRRSSRDHKDRQDDRGDGRRHRHDDRSDGRRHRHDERSTEEQQRKAERHRPHSSDSGGENSPPTSSRKKASRSEEQRGRRDGGHRRRRSPEDSRSPPPSTRRDTRRPPSARQGERSGETPHGDTIPAWKKAILNKKQQKPPQHKDPEPEPEPEPDCGQTEGSIPVPVYQGLPREDISGENLPAWKATLFRKRQNEVEEVGLAERRRQAEEEARYAGLPEWKKKLMKQKHSEAAVSAAVVRGADLEKQRKMAEISSMPEWKRKLFLERNPQYRS